jgi:two-component system phosphate regulon sensor histidine kinase PhoR
MDGAIDDEEVRLVFLKKAMKNTDRLSNLVNDLLIITQIEAGELEMKMRRFYIFDLLEDVIESVEHKFTKRNRNIHYSIQSNSHENTFVRADRERIQQVLTNLVDNAIKYGNPDGNIDIILEQIDDKIWVRVRDESPGIAPEHLENIFRRFYRIDKSRSREKGGTGLGLSICKHFIEAHGETLSVHSILGVGTTFSFSLKVAEKSQETSPKNA